MSELIRFLEEVPAVMLKLVCRVFIFTPKISYGLADFQINMTKVRKVLPAFHFYTLRHVKPI